MPTNSPSEAAETSVRPIIDWLSAAHGQTAVDNVAILRSHLHTLREAGLPPARQLQLLDFLYDHSLKVVNATLPDLHQFTLPVSRKLRQKIRGIQALLESIAQDYLCLLAGIFANNAESVRHPLELSAWRAVYCLHMHLLTSYLTTSPPGVGIWQSLHGAYLLAKQHDLADQRIPRQELTLEQLYLSTVLLSCSQPASFSALELDFVVEYIGRGVDGIRLDPEIPGGRQALFWIDQSKDAPAHALARRVPPPESPILFFACDDLAFLALDHLQQLERDYPPHQLDLPDFAGTPAGHGVLRRLAARWGSPAKRRFPRRRHSFRVSLCAGLENIWQLLHRPDEAAAPTSEWMITNESPDGCAMMHMAGNTETVHVGDLVAIRGEMKADAQPSPWNVCIVRWALSENPEHIELGLQILAPTALPALLSQINDAEDIPPQSSALLLPQVPPLRHTESLVLPTGTLDQLGEKFALLLDQDKILLREMHATAISEQTSSIEVFSVATDERP